MSSRAISLLAACVFVFVFAAEVSCRAPVETSASQDIYSRLSPSSSQIGADIMIKDLGITEDMELYILLANAGMIDLREGAKLRLRIFMNHRKVSEFDHLMSNRLRAHLKNYATIRPPYSVAVTRTSRVKVSVRPLDPPEDIRPENNTVERSILIFPFRLERRSKQEFSFPVPSRNLTGGGGEEKVKTEARRDGGMAALRLSMMRPGGSDVSPISGKSPLKMELTILEEEIQRRNVWRVSVTNLIPRRVEGHLVIQHP